MARVIQCSKVGDEFSLKTTKEQDEKNLILEIEKTSPIDYSSPCWRQVKFDLERFIHRAYSLGDSVIMKTLKKVKLKSDSGTLTLQDLSHLVMNHFFSIRNRLYSLLRKYKKTSNFIRVLITNIHNLSDRMFPNMGCFTPC